MAMVAAGMVVVMPVVAMVVAARMVVVMPVVDIVVVADMMEVGGTWVDTAMAVVDMRIAGLNSAAALLRVMASADMLSAVDLRAMAVVDLAGMLVVADVVVADSTVDADNG